MNERMIELVNGELDGTNTTDESAELARLLEADESAKTYFQETEAFFKALGSVADVETPAGLKNRIMDSIDITPATAASPSSGFVASLKSLFEPVMRRPAWAMSYAFAAGLIVGMAVLLLVFQPTAPPPEAVQGTIGRVPSTIVDEARLHVAGLTVELTTSRTQTESILDIRIMGSGEATIRVDERAGRDVTVISAPGPGHFTIELDAPGDVEIGVSSSGEEASTRLAAGGGRAEIHS